MFTVSLLHIYLQTNIVRHAELSITVGHAPAVQHLMHWRFLFSPD